MTATLEASASARVSDLERRLDALRAEDEKISAALDRHEEGLGRLVAAGGAEEERRRIRSAIADLEAQRRGVRAAIPLVEADLRIAEADAHDEHLSQLQAEAERAAEAYRVAFRAEVDALIRLSREYSRIRAERIRTYRVASAAKKEALRAGGVGAADAHEASRHVLPFADLPISGQASAVFEDLGRMLASWAGPAGGGDGE